jgi:hypothetical protein
MATRGRVTLLTLAFLASAPTSGYAQENGNLLAMSGGRLVPWALITSHNPLGSEDPNLQTTGAAVRLHDRLELSFTHEWFGGATKPGAGYQLRIDGIGARLKLVGDTVYDPDRRLPQAAFGTQFKSANQQGSMPSLGMHSPDGVDIYISATKLFQAESLLFDGTIRPADSNPFGLPKPPEQATAE